MTLNGGNVTLTEIKLFYGADHKNFNEGRPKLSAEKCRSMILVSRNIRCMLIFAGVHRGGASNDGMVVEVRNFHRLLLAISFLLLKAEQEAALSQGGPCDALYLSKCRK